MTKAEIRAALEQLTSELQGELLRARRQDEHNEREVVSNTGMKGHLDNLDFLASKYVEIANDLPQPEPEAAEQEKKPEAGAAPENLPEPPLVNSIKQDSDATNQPLPPSDGDTAAVVDDTPSPNDPYNDGFTEGEGAVDKKPRKR